MATTVLRRPKKKPLTQVENLAELLDRLGNVPLERIRFGPSFGSATEEDVLRLLEAAGLICFGPVGAIKWNLGYIQWKRPPMRGISTTLVFTCLFVAMALSLTGCGKKTYPVQGQLVFDDDTPAKELAGYTIMFESQEKKADANGTVQPDGSFTVGTFQDGDGAAPGKFRVALTPPAPPIDAPRQPPLIAERYGKFEESKLEVEIKSEVNKITLKVERLKR